VNRSSRFAHARAIGPRERGTSLIEVVIACVLLGILASAVLTIILQTQSAGVTNRARIAAASLAAREIDMVRDEFTRSDTAPLAIVTAGTQTNANPLDGQTAGAPLVIDGTAYTVVRSVAWNITGTGASACTGGSLVVYPTLGVTVSVTWPNMGSVKPVVSTAALAPAKGNGIPGTASFVAVAVKDAAAHPSVGRTVTVTGGGSTVTGSTDASGCAVLQVSPAAGAGTAYTAQVSDAGYVDLARDPAPTKSVGTLTQGQLNNSVTFSYDLAGAINLHFVDAAGIEITGVDLIGAQVTLVASQFAGASGESPWPVTGPFTTVSGLWPTQYGAYFGTTPPAGGYMSVDVAPGATADLTVVVATAQASFPLPSLPAGWTTVIAVPGIAAACTDPGNRTVDPAGFRVPLGAWSFFATGPNYVCSPGEKPANLISEYPVVVPWDSTTLKVTNAPAGEIWAVNRSKVTTGTLSTCPGATYAGVAVNISGARDAAAPIPAGDWYVYVTDTGAAGSCQGVPSQYSKVLGYGSASTLVWVIPNAVVTISNAPTGGGWKVRASPVSSNCDATGSIDLNQSGSVFNGTLTPGTWYIWSKNSGSCQEFGGTVIVGGQTAYSLTFNDTLPPVVGP